MTFVITHGCCEDASCVPVCPVQCIRPRPGDPDFTTTEQLYIDPAHCIDCGACARACPVEAICAEDELPPELADFGSINADYFAAHPLEDVTPPPIRRRRLPKGQSDLRVVIVGAGPSALYAAAELSEIRGATVTILERTPTPFGLVRAGVAPDHARTKLIEDHFARVLRRHNVVPLFNVEVGRCVSVAELLRHHHAVLWAAGASDDRRMGIVGEDQHGSVSARELVSWYNGHPDFGAHRFDLSSKRAVVIGNGNVALDVARVLSQPASAYESTSISDVALEALRGSAIEEVVVIGRRGQAFAAYSTGELLALSRLPDVDLLADPVEASVTRQELDATGRTARAGFARRRAVIDAAARRTPTKPRRIVMRYRLVPIELAGNGAVTGIVLGRPDGTVEQLETSLVVRAVGFEGRAAPGIPFDSTAGIIPNDAGRVVDPTTGRPVPGIYCTGWIKRGPSGFIGTNRADSAETVASLLSDFTEHQLPDPPEDVAELINIVRQRQPTMVDASAWWRIDESERRAGRASGRSRVKLVTHDGLLRAAEVTDTSSGRRPEQSAYDGPQH